MNYEDDDELPSHPCYRDGHCGCADYHGGFVDGYRAAEHDLATREQAVTNRERVAAQLDRDTKLYMAEQEERHRRTLEVLDAEVARLKEYGDEGARIIGRMVIVDLAVRPFVAAYESECLPFRSDAEEEWKVARAALDKFDADEKKRTAPR